MADTPTDPNINQEPGAPEASVPESPNPAAENTNQDQSSGAAPTEPVPQPPNPTPPPPPVQDVETPAAPDLVASEQTTPSDPVAAPDPPPAVADDPKPDVISSGIETGTATQPDPPVNLTGESQPGTDQSGVASDGPDPQPIPPEAPNPPQPLTAEEVGPPWLRTDPNVRAAQDSAGGTSIENPSLSPTSQEAPPPWQGVQPEPIGEEIPQESHFPVIIFVVLVLGIIVAIGVFLFTQGALPFGG
ncbi:MAG: hypothetical protein Q8O75_03755 [bacterium]|nr:hypothetical protein [bacterium]